MKIISLWSGPRNVSTALMYSFAQRKDTKVIDEPLYAYYLEITGAEHPGREEVLADMSSDGNKVLEDIINSTSDQNLFLKNMAHHWIDLKDDFLDHFSNIFLIRNPVEMLPSLNKQLQSPVLRDTGLKKQVDLFKHLKSRGQTPMIIDSKRLLQNPSELLKAACESLDLPFDNNMLQWKAGARPEDGIWHKYWYHNVHKSEGFGKYQEKNEPFPDHLKPLLEECLPYYEFLLDQSLNYSS